MEIVREGLLQRNTFRLCTLCYFIAGGIHDHAWVVVILLHHILQVLLPPVRHERSIVMLGFVHVPAVNIFIHHQHAKPVTCIQQIFRCRIVSGPNCIVAGLLQNADPAFLYLWVGAGTENAIVVMDAGAANYRALSVNGHTFVRRPRQGADAEVLFHHILAKCHTGSI